MSFFKTPTHKQTDILTCCPSPILLVSENGTITFANPQAAYTLGYENLSGRKLSDILAINFQSLIKIGYEKSVAQYAIDGRAKKFFEVQASVIPDESVFVVAINDITQINSVIQNYKTECEKEEKNNHRKNVLLVKMANHLKSPLHSAIGFSQAILEGLGGDINDKQEKYIRIIHKNVTELLALIEKIIELSQAESNMFQPSMKSFDILNALHSVLTDVKPSIEEKKLQLKLDTNFLDKRTAYTDETIFKIALDNLLKNAIASCDVGSITIKLSTPSNELISRTLSLDSVDRKCFLLVDIIDTGVGMQSNEIPYLFDPYIQIDKNTKKNLLKGLTLGVTKEFVEKIKGKIWAQSELMKESKFSFIIPISREYEKTIENLPIDESAEETLEETKEE